MALFLFCHRGLGDEVAREYRGTCGNRGPGTEQFAFGMVMYIMRHGHEV